MGFTAFLMTKWTIGSINYKRKQTRWKVAKAISYRMVRESPQGSVCTPLLISGFWYEGLPDPCHYKPHYSQCHRADARPRVQSKPRKSPSGLVLGQKTRQFPPHLLREDKHKVRFSHVQPIIQPNEGQTVSTKGGSRGLNLGLLCLKLSRGTWSDTLFYCLVAAWKERSNTVSI